MTKLAEIPGFIALSCSDSCHAAPDLRAALAAIGADAPALSECGTLRTATWGLDAHGFDRSQPLMLCRFARRRDDQLDLHDIRGLLQGSAGDGLAEVAPTFGAVDCIDEDTIVAAADPLGFRHLYYGEGVGFAVLSTSARAVGACLGSGLDQEAIALQSLLGWQLGQRSLFKGVHKLAPGERGTLGGGRISTQSVACPPDRVNGGVDGLVADAATMLRDYLDAFLEDYPDPVLQLTGGQDSRLLLSAIPPARRRGLRAVTLCVPGSPDNAIAAALAGRHGLSHEVLTLDGLEMLSNEEADLRCIEASRRLDCMADPLALAALRFAEDRAEPGARISGLGGEVARGFYYFGRANNAPVTRKRVERLTSWRMFANDAVAATALEPDFATWARDFSVGEVFALTSATGRKWMAATDEFYLYQRMQRWAGINSTAVCFDRLITNPMLDDRFITIARSLSPRDKKNSMFLARLQVALDDELARVPLDGRPPPLAYASRTVRNSTLQLACTARKAARKAHQLATRASTPPAGGALLARKVVEHWRANPALLDSARAAAIFHEPWVEQVLAGDLDPTPSDVALMTNLRVATA